LGGANPPLPIGIGLYGDTLCRLDGGIDHTYCNKKFSKRLGASLFNFFLL